MKYETLLVYRHYDMLMTSDPGVPPALHKSNTPDSTHLLASKDYKTPRWACQIREKFKYVQCWVYARTIKTAAI